MVHVYTPAALHSRLVELEAARGWSHADLILHAIDATHDTLPVPPAQPAPDGALFTRSRRQRTPAPRDAVTIGVRLARTDVDQINDLVSASTAASRSAYIVAALQAFLAMTVPQEETRD